MERISHDITDLAKVVGGAVWRLFTMPGPDISGEVSFFQNARYAFRDIALAEAQYRASKLADPKVRHELNREVLNQWESAKAHIYTDYILPGDLNADPSKVVSEALTEDK